MGFRNFSSACLNGSSNRRTSNIVDHAQSDQHKAAMNQTHTAIARGQNKPIFAVVASSVELELLLKLDPKQHLFFEHFPCPVAITLPAKQTKKVQAPRGGFLARELLFKSKLNGRFYRSRYELVGH